jgi:GAF domain-containing protein
LVVGDLTLAQTLTRVAELAIDAVPAADMAGIALIVKDREATSSVAHETAPAGDQDHYRSATGPGLTSFDDQRILPIDATLGPRRWQVFRDMAAEHDVLSTLTVPLDVDHRPVGALNLYAKDEGAFSEADTETATSLATQAAVALANSQAYWDAHDLNARLSEAMAHRAVIEQAKGILMAAQRCGPDEAFILLVKASQHQNVKLRHIAQRIVTATPVQHPNAPAGDPA